MSIAVCTLCVLTMLFAALTNRDMLSPGKFYLISFVMFYVGALATQEHQDLWLLILLVLLVGLATVCFEASSSAGPHAHEARRFDGRRAPQRNVALWVWIASLPAIAAQIYIVRLFGGIEGYINVIGDRVIELRGLGPAKTMISTIVVSNLIYFGVGLTRVRSRWWWSLYILHVSIVLVIGALSGSRGSILTVFATQVFLYHYLRRPVKMVFALSIGTALLAFAMIIGVLRSGIRVEDSRLTTGLVSPEQILNLPTFNLGVTPLQILLRADDLRLANGSTLLSVLTNVVPRNMWPEKPDTGGVFFTKVYTGNAWDGASNLTPTFLGEWVINFGWLGGLALFIVVNVGLMYWVVNCYWKMLEKLRAPPDPGVAIDVVIYVLLMWAAVGLMVGEVTNTLQTFVVTQLLPALVYKAILHRKNRPGSGPEMSQRMEFLAPLR